jgi:hypothetical protein
VTATTEETTMDIRYGTLALHAELAEGFDRLLAVRRQRRRFPRRSRRGGGRGSH